MLRSLKDTYGRKVWCIDGEVGTVRDVLYHEHEWTADYVVIDTEWLGEKLVLVRPDTLQESPDNKLTIQATRLDVESAPALDSALPPAKPTRVSINAPVASGNVFTLGAMGGYAQVVPSPVSSASVAMPGEQLRSHSFPVHAARETNGHRIKARDGEIGRVIDFLVDESWLVRYAVVDTTDWMPGGHVLVATDWISDVDWQREIVAVTLDTAQIKGAPAFKSTKDVSREYEEQLYAHYGQPGYWTRA